MQRINREAVFRAKDDRLRDLLVRSLAGDNAAYLQTFPNARAVTPVSASAPTTLADNAPSTPVFRSI